MSTSTTTRLMTADEFLALGPKFHGELVRGRLVEMAPASWKHGQHGGQALMLIKQFVDQHHLGVVVAAETGFVLARDPDCVRAPDVGFITSARAAAASDSGFFEGPPDLAVEVLSPRDTVIEVEEKIEEYINAGCRLVWVINHRAKTITVYRASVQPNVLKESETITGGEVLPGFSSRVSDFFVA